MAMNFGVHIYSTLKYPYNMPIPINIDSKGHKHLILNTKITN